LAYRIYDEESKKITAKAIREVKADVICLQEVESLPVLDRFNAYYCWCAQRTLRNLSVVAVSIANWNY